MKPLIVDTETYLLAPGTQAPRVVSVQVPGAVYPRAEGITYVADHLARGGAIAGHNIAFDAAAMIATAPAIAPLVFDAYDSDRVVCTIVRQKLIEIAHGCYRGRGRGRQWGYGLDSCVERMCHGRLPDKASPWRLRYGTLDDVPITEWPPEAYDYALHDANATADLFAAQQAHVDLLHDQFSQSRAAFWLYLMSCRGLRCDPLAVADAIERFRADAQAGYDLLVREGLVRQDGSRRTHAAKERMRVAMAAHGDPPKITATGQKMAEHEGWDVETLLTETGSKYIALDEDACHLAGDPILDAYQRYVSHRGLLKRLQSLHYGGYYPIQCRYDSLVETGRTSCTMGDVDPSRLPPAYGFQVQNPPRIGGLRECFVPRSGYWYLSCDWSGMELCTWAQVCLWIVGSSRMAEVLNSGGDPHTDLGATLRGVTTDDVKAYDPQTYAEFKGKERQTAKIANFGFPGGMGPPKLRLQARAQYGVTLSVEDVYHLRDAWRTNWPESQGYFAWAAEVSDRDAQIEQFVSRRVRAGIQYTQICNTMFQGLAADAAKWAGWQITKECYLRGGSPLGGSFPVAFLHDEFILEVPAVPELAHRAAQRVRDIMTTAGDAYTPDVRLDAEPVLMRRWRKDAFAKIENGLLTPCDD